MSVTPGNANGLDLTPTLGPLYWGFVISLVLTGITVVQAYIYFPRPDDRPSIQIIAGMMLLFDVTSSALVAQSVYYYLVPHFGSLSPLGSITNELSAECLLSTIITFVSQLYFAVQLHGVAKAGRASILVPISVALFALLAFAGGVGCTTVMVVHHTGVLGNRAPSFSIFFGLAKGFGALTDIVATIAMCILLASSRTGMHQTNSLLKKLMQYIVHRGVLVTLIQTLLLIVFYSNPSHLYWLAFHVNVTKLYANTFFAMLNARDRLGQKHSVMTSSLSSYGHSSREQKRTHLGSAVTEEVELEDTELKFCNMPTVTKTVVIANI